MKKKIVVILVCTLLIGTGTIVVADWNPGDGHKMHFPQLPDETGWDVYATAGLSDYGYQEICLADDWECNESGPVTDIHFWGSWKGGITGTINGFQLAIYTDIPADPPQNPYSRPGTILWEWTCYDWDEVMINPPPLIINEIYYDEPASDENCYTELSGTPGTSLDGYKLVGVNGANGEDYDEIDLSGYVIPSDGYFVVGQNDGVVNVDMISGSVNWQNGPDNVQLRMGEQVIDAVGYGDFSGGEIFVGEGQPAEDTPAGYSLGRWPDSSDTDDNSVDFIIMITLTPGESNLELFGGKSNPQSMQGWYNPSNGTVIENDHFTYFQYNIENISNPFNQVKGTIYWLCISAIVAHNPSGVQPLWGWKSSMNHWNGAACWYDLYTQDWIDIGEPPLLEQSLDLAFVINGEASNNPPTEPDIDGPNEGSPGQELCWDFHSDDPDENQIKYIIDWGDGNTSETGFNPPCTPVEVCHTYEVDGDYVITAFAEDEKGLMSDESSFSVKVTTPRARTVYHPLIQSLFERFPNLFPILRQLLG
jgi:hypothetical protein